jgi:flavorubredoxin
MAHTRRGRLLSIWVTQALTRESAVSVEESVLKRDLRKAAVIYDSKFGNTEKIARALSEGMKSGGLLVDCPRTDAVDPGKLGEYDMLVVGAPTQMLGVSGPTKGFLK